MSIESNFFNLTNINRQTVTIAKILDIPISNKEMLAKCKKFLLIKMKNVYYKYANLKPKNMPVSIFVEKLNKKSISDFICEFRERAKKKHGMKHLWDYQSQRIEDVEGKKEIKLQDRPKFTQINNTQKGTISPTNSFQPLRQQDQFASCMFNPQSTKESMFISATGEVKQGVLNTEKTIDGSISQKGDLSQQYDKMRQAYNTRPNVPPNPFQQNQTHKNNSQNNNSQNNNQNNMEFGTFESTGTNGFNIHDGRPSSSDDVMNFDDVFGQKKDSVDLQKMLKLITDNSGDNPQETKHLQDLLVNMINKNEEEKLVKEKEKFSDSGDVKKRLSQMQTERANLTNQLQQTQNRQGKVHFDPMISPNQVKSINNQANPQKDFFFQEVEIKHNNVTETPTMSKEMSDIVTKYAQNKEIGDVVHNSSQNVPIENILFSDNFKKTINENDQIKNYLLSLLTNNTNNTKQIKEEQEIQEIPQQIKNKELVFKINSKDIQNIENGCNLSIDFSDFVDDIKLIRILDYNFNFENINIQKHSNELNLSLEGEKEFNSIEIKDGLYSIEKLIEIFNEYFKENKSGFKFATTSDNIVTLTNTNYQKFSIKNRFNSLMYILGFMKEFYSGKTIHNGETIPDQNLFSVVDVYMPNLLQKKCITLDLKDRKQCEIPLQNPVSINSIELKLCIHNRDILYYFVNPFEITFLFERK